MNRVPEEFSETCFSSGLNLKMHHPPWTWFYVFILSLFFNSRLFMTHCGPHRVKKGLCCIVRDQAQFSLMLINTQLRIIKVTNKPIWVRETSLVYKTTVKSTSNITTVA